MNLDWFYISVCQCNGHSSCTNQSDVCDQCMNLTEGANCETCKEGYWGNPRNGGNCTGEKTFSALFSSPEPKAQVRYCKTCLN